MKRRFLPFVLRAVLAAAPVLAMGAAPPSDLYARMQHANAGLQSYTATLHVDVKMNSFPYLSPALDGMAYFKRPDKNAVVFNTVPALAQQFKKVYPQMEPPSVWPTLYDVTPLNDDGTQSSYRLVRRKEGRIDHVDVKVDDATAMVVSQQYVYRDGGSVQFTQTYDHIGSNYVIKAQTGKVDLPHYSADVSSSFSNYKLNVDVPDSVFAQ